jgi:WD40 repeat protein
MRLTGVGGLAYLHDGRGVVLVGRQVELWDLAAGQRQSTTEVSPVTVSSVQVRQDGKVLLLSDADGWVREWDPATLTELRAWQTGQRAIRTACYSPDGKRVLTAADNPPGLKEWDLATGRELVAIKSNMVSIRAGAIYGPGAQTAILGGGYEHQLERWDLAGGELVKQWRSVYEVKSLALAPDEKSVLMGCEDRAEERSLETYEVVRTYKHCPGEAARVFHVAYLPGTDEVLCGGRDGSLHRWKRATGELALSWRPHQAQVLSMAVSPDGQWALSYGAGRLAETSLRTGEPRLKWDCHSGGVECLAFLPGGQTLVTGSSDATVRLWDVSTGKTERLFTGAALGALSLAVSPDGSRIAVGCKDGVVREYDVAEGIVRRELTGHLGFIRAVRYGPQGGVIHSSADDGTVRVWDETGPEPHQVLRGHRGGVLGLAVSADGRQVLSCGRDGTVRLWEAQTGRELRRVDPAAGWLSTVAFLPNDQQVLTAGRDGVIRDYDLATGQCLLGMPQESWVHAVACSGDGRRVYGADGGGRLVAWDSQTGQELAACVHGAAVTALALDVATDRVATGSQDTTALVWQLPAVAGSGVGTATPLGPLTPRPVRRLETYPDHDSVGCEANPTGDPIGGGAGYRDIKTSGDFTVRTREELLGALQQAQAGQVVFVPDGVELDLTGVVNQPIPAGVTLAGTRGLNGSLGARLFTALRATSPLLYSRGDNVRITGLRIEGPYAGPELIAEFSYGLSIAHHNCEVDNCEVYNWNCVGIGVGGGGEVFIHHNDIHHCQLSGYGYGVATGRANCFIIANKFDWCRHDIASSGSPGDCYEAAWNWTGPNATSHRFDMHGGRDRGDGTQIAGDWMSIHHNTFADAERRAVVIRGVPSQGADIHHNWFAHPAPTDTVSSDGNTTVHHNACGPEKKLVE